ncbi:MAG: DNA-directed RNA polymerase subunit omega [Dysgonamonadaceae bacterium]|jgi:hypothetical protein|nr:DNA-directed RNA polymerase subunit omega [Dysgonamonadaceae bacterium]
MEHKTTKRAKAPNNTITLDMATLTKETGNIYETVRIIGKRANAISVKVKQQESKKLMEFSSGPDTLEEIFENREQIETSRHFERLPKPTLLAVSEFLNNEIYFQNPAKERAKMKEL